MNCTHFLFIYSFDITRKLFQTNIKRARQAECRRNGKGMKEMKAIWRKLNKKWHLNPNKCLDNLATLPMAHFARKVIRMKYVCIIFVIYHHWATLEMCNAIGYYKLNLSILGFNSSFRHGHLWDDWSELFDNFSLSLPFYQNNATITAYEVIKSFYNFQLENARAIMKNASWVKNNFKSFYAQKWVCIKISSMDSMHFV